MSLINTGSFCLSYCACKAFTSSCELPFTLSRFMYLAYMFASTMFAFLLYQMNGKSIDINIDWHGIHYQHTLCEHQCVGDEAVFRISLALTMFYILMSLCTSTMSQLSTRCQTRYWVFKSVLLLSFICISPLVPYEFISVYSILCKYATLLFLLIQTCILIDFGYTCNDTLIAYGTSLSKIAIIIASVGLNVGMVAIVCSLYTNVVYGILILFGNVFMTGLSVSPLAPHGTLFTSSIVAFQIAYMYTIGHKNITLSNGLITTLSLVFSAYSTSKTNVFHIYEVPKVNELVLLDSKVLLDEENQVILPEEKKEYIVSGFYHITLALCSMYMPIVLIGFDHDSPDNPEIIITQILGGLLYTWTLIAPSLFPHREFQ